MIENRTPHDVHFITTGGVDVNYPPLGEKYWTRVSEIRERLGVVRDYGIEVPINRRRFDREGATGVPDKRDGALYIVSQIVAEAFPERDDFIVPDEIVRDDVGRIVGCKAFARHWPGAYSAIRDAAKEARKDAVQGTRLTDTSP